MLYGITLQMINMADWLKEQHPIETEGKLINSSVTNAKFYPQISHGLAMAKLEDTA